MNITVLGAARYQPPLLRCTAWIKAALRIHRLPLPPFLLRSQQRYDEMQMRRPRIGIPGRSDIPDQLPPRYMLPLPQSLRVPIQVRVLVAIHRLFAECSTVGVLPSSLLADSGANRRERAPANTAFARRSLSDSSGGWSAAPTSRQVGKISWVPASG
jgi:hypothetical protein